MDGPTKNIGRDGIAWRDGTFLVLYVLFLWCLRVQIASDGNPIADFDVGYEEIDGCGLVNGDDFGL